MEIEKALSIIGRQGPCGHHTVDMSLGDGKTWAKCEDCGATIAQDSILTARAAEARFDEAIATIRKALSEVSVG